MKIALHLARTTRTLLVTGLLLAALGLSAARYWLPPKIDAYRQALQDGASAAMGQPLRIGGLSARMRGFYPELVLNDVAVVDATSGAIKFMLGQIHVGIDLPRWLISGEWRTDWIALYNADLALRRRADGKIILEGMQSREDEGLPPWLFGYGRIELRNSKLHWHDESKDGVGLDFSSINLLIANNGGHHHIAVDLVQAKAEDGRLRMVAELDGDMARPAELRGQIFVHGRQMRAEAWPLPTMGGLRFSDGTANFRLWADWQDGALQRVAGWVSLARPLLAYKAFGAPEREKLVAAQGLDGWFRWLRAENGWRLEMTQLRPNLNGSPWPESRFSVDYKGGTLRAALDYARLDDLATVLHALAPVMPVEGLTTLNHLGLRGELRDLSLSSIGAADQPLYSLCTQFNGFGVNAYESLPGLTGLTGSACGNDREAVVDLSSGPGDVDLTQWFRAPLEYTRVDGRLHWHRDGAAWALSGEDLSLTTPHGALTSRFLLTMPAVGSPLLNGSAHLQGGDMRGIFHYLPVHIMPKSTLEWLDAAFLGGRILGGEARIYGPLAAFPYLNGDGLFQVRVDVADARLRFATGWQPLTDLSAQLLFDGDSLEVLDGQGRLGETVASQIAVRIDHMVPSGLLLLAGRVEGRLPQVLDYFANTPGAALVEKVRAHTEMDGHTAIDLLLGYAFNADDDEAVHVQGEVRVEDGRVRQLESGLVLKGLSGNVRFRDSRIEADKLQASLLGAPALVSLSGDGAELHVAVSGHITVPKLRDQFAGSEFARRAPAGGGLRIARHDNPAGQPDCTAKPPAGCGLARHEWLPAEAWNGFKGKLGYQAELVLPQDFNSGPSTEIALRREVIREGISDSQQGLTLNLTGDLLDTAVDLPSPFGKLAGETGFLRLQAAWDERGGVAARGDYRGLAKLQTKLRKDSGHWEAETGELLLGDTSLAQPPTLGWRIAGRLAAVPLDAWWERLSEHAQVMAFGGKIRQVDMVVEQPSWKGREWGQVSLRLNRLTEAWDGYVESAFATGALRLPLVWPSDTPVVLDLERIVLPTMSKSTLERTSQAQINPAQLPTMQIHSRQLLWQKHDLGQLDCTVERQPTGLRLQQCGLTSDLQQTSLQGEWERVGGKDFSRLDGKMKIKDLGQLLKQLGLGDEVVATPAKLKFALQWQDAPHRVTASKLNGDLAVNLSQGSLRHVEPGVGRALGLFNIETLKRRLLLDFSDVFEEGLSYDKVRGIFKITDGLAVTHNLFIDAPAARVFFNGSVDLAGRTFDQLVTVMPRTSIAWPIVGTLAGGPAVGAAVLLAQQLVGEKLENITASQYAVKGSWDDPTVVLLTRNMPMDMLQRAWRSVKDLSGLAETEPE